MGLFDTSKQNDDVSSLFAPLNPEIIKKSGIKNESKEKKIAKTEKAEKNSDEKVPKELEKEDVVNSEDEEESNEENDDVDAVNSQSEQKDEQADIEIEDAYFLKINEKEKKEELKRVEADDSNKEEKTSTQTDSLTAENGTEEPAYDTKDAETTLFVKNIPNKVLLSNQNSREFRRLFGPGIKTLRFRSIAMSEAIPRKAAFVQRKVHETRVSINAYIVYKTKDQFYEKLNSMNLVKFMDHNLFVDKVNARMASKQAVFVGNLPFDAGEQQLYEHFRDCGNVQNVRVVRDKKYNIGKGFAYVQFEDVSSVQVALQKHDSEFQNRKLRVTKCASLHAQSQRKPFNMKQTTRSRQHAQSKKKEEKEKGKDSGNLKTNKKANGLKAPVFEGLRAQPGTQPSTGSKRKRPQDQRKRRKAS
ncbi:Nop12 protein [Starmerella bacillaris]|uniref:Nucleolar protein 12 n=1 Tax=Starmerella bacillaris TaxID=1247836 RepID=A0AAV5RC77_STABA|nr:Nop12 protein [Starmerella bacillaris]